MLKLSKFWPSHALNQILIPLKTQTWITFLKIFQSKFLSSFENFYLAYGVVALIRDMQQVGYCEWGWITDEGNIKPRDNNSTGIERMSKVNIVWMSKTV